MNRIFDKTGEQGASTIRKSTLCLTLLVIMVLLCGLMFAHAALRRQADREHLALLRASVKELGLTDLCFFTEARYSRHLSQADLYSAFQDHPTALEHFPTGSIAGPPAALRRFHGALD